MTARPYLDDRDPQPAETWRPVSSEWARRQAIDATRAAVNAAKDRKTENRNATEEKP